MYLTMQDLLFDLPRIDYDRRAKMVRLLIDSCRNSIKSLANYQTLMKRLLKANAIY